MKILSLIGKATLGAAAGVALVTALPIAGAVGTITAVGATVASVAGAAAGVAEHVSEGNENK